MEKTSNVLVESDPEGHLIASVPELPGCHTQAGSFAELEEPVVEAIRLCLDEQGIQPEEETQDYFGNFRITVPA